MAQPATTEAMAMPGAPIEGNSVSAMAMLIATEIAAKIIGVRVSSRAKKPGVNALMRTKAGRPRPKMARMLPTIAVSSCEKAPRS